MIKQLVLYGLILAFFPAAGRSDDSPGRPAFTDQDGDGINDNLADDDNSGIPDRFESKVADTVGPAGSLLGEVFNAASTQTASDDLLSRVDRFFQRRFKTRMLVHRCHCFGGDEDFGPGNGIGMGAMGGAGGCAGGACSP